MLIYLFLAVLGLPKKIFFFLMLIYLFLAVLGLEKAMAPHSSSLAWKIPWMAKPGRLQSMGSLRVGCD